MPAAVQQTGEPLAGVDIPDSGTIVADGANKIVADPNSKPVDVNANAGVQHDPISSSPMDDKSGTPVTMDDFTSVLNDKSDVVPASERSEASRSNQQSATDKTSITQIPDDKSKTGVPPVTQDKPTLDANGKPLVTAQATTQVNGRDYTDIPVEHQELFKKMSNDAYNLLKPLYIESKKQSDIVKTKDTEIAELKKNRIPDSYHEHEAGYILHPEYIQLATNQKNLQSFASHWEQQLVNIREGKPWNEIVQDKVTGQYVLGPDITAIPQHEAHVIRNLTHVQGQLQGMSEKVTNFSNGFKGRVTEATQQVREAEKQFFGAYEDPENPAKDIIKHAYEQIPAVYRNSPLAPLLAKAITACVQQKAIITELTNKASQATTVATVKAADEKAAGPTSSQTVATTAVVEPVVTVDDFEALKN